MEYGLNCMRKKKIYKIVDYLNHRSPYRVRGVLFLAKLLYVRTSLTLTYAINLYYTSLPNPVVQGSLIQDPPLDRMQINVTE
jgi:hypothetical protein